MYGKRKEKNKGVERERDEESGYRHMNKIDPISIEKMGPLYILSQSRRKTLQLALRS